MKDDDDLLDELKDSLDDLCDDDDSEACEQLEEAVEELDPIPPGGPGLDLWRVGVPSIGETWPRRFKHIRSTGGIGTGVYAFRDEEPARQNVAGKPDDAANTDVFHLRNALKNPIQPVSKEATEILNRLGRRMSIIAFEMSRDEPRGRDMTWGEVFDRGGFLSLTVHGGLGGDPRIGEGSSRLGRNFIDLLGDTPELREKYGYSSEELAEDALRATKQALEDSDVEAGSLFDRDSVQPMNYLLWPEFDGVAPKDGAGGNMGKFGCLILIERIRQCVPSRDLGYNDRIDAGLLNDCFSRG